MTKTVSEKQLQAIKIIGEWQYDLYITDEEFKEGMLWFEDYGQAIINPFMSNCSRFDVTNPCEEYEDFLESSFITETNKFMHLESSQEIADAVIEEIKKEIARLN